MSNKTVLIADDSAISRKILSRRLSFEQIEHVVCSCGHSALVQLKKAHTEDRKLTIAILDESMTISDTCMNGSQVVAHWKEMYPEKKVTFFSYSSNKVEGKGFEGAYVKPDLEHLIRAVKAIYFS